MMRHARWVDERVLAQRGPLCDVGRERVARGDREVVRLMNGPPLNDVVFVEAGRVAERAVAHPS